MTRKTKSCAGYSMVELLTVLAVLMGIQAMAYPSIVELLNTMRLRSGADALLTSLNLARSAAVQRNVRVVLCKSTNGSSCSDSNDWNAGWLVFQDANNSGTLDEGEALIYRQNALQGHLQLTGNVTVNEYVSYTPFGQAKLLKGGFQAGTFTVCSKEGGRKDGYQVFVASSGRARLAKAPDTCL
jgi:type IV fimbrial biogenesis protein FimT